MREWAFISYQKNFYGLLQILSLIKQNSVHVYLNIIKAGVTFPPLVAEALTHRRSLS